MHLNFFYHQVIDPWGCVVAECSDKVGFITAEIDLDYVAKRREGMPVWQHRRSDLYGLIQVNSKGKPQTLTTFSLIFFVNII